MLSEKRRQLIKNLTIPLGLFLLLALGYLFVIPSGESPDEGGHVQCIEQVSRFNRLPIMEPKPSGLTWERTYALSGIVCYHMPGYYLLTGYLQKALHTITNKPLHYEFPPSNPNGPSPNMFLHASKTKPLSLEEPATMILPRLFSIFMWGFMVLLTYCITRRVMPQQKLAALLALTLLAGWPQFLFMSRAINNDALSIPLSILVLWLLLDIGKPNRFIWATLFACLAVLSKFTTIYLLIMLLLVIPAEIWFTPINRKSYLASTLLSLAILLGTVLLITQHPVLSEHTNYTFRVTSKISDNASNWSYWGDVVQLTLSSGWVGFGMMNIFAPQWQAYLWWSFIGLFSVIGIFRFIKLNYRQTNFKMQAFIVLLWVGAIVGGYLRINLNRFQPQFRYLFALLPIFTMFSGIGLAQTANFFAKSQKSRELYLVGTLAAFLFLVNSWIIWQIVIPAYNVY